MSKKIIPLLFLLASSGMTYAVKGKNAPVTTQEDKESSSQSSNKEDSIVEEKTIYSLLMPMPPLPTILKFELFGVAMIIIHFYNTYIPQYIARSLMSAICLVTAFLEASSYQPSIIKESNKEDDNAFYHTLIAKLIRFVMSIGFEVLGAVAFFFVHWGIKGIKEKIDGLAANTTAGLLTLLGIAIFLGPPTIIYFFFLRTQRKERENKNR